eukprot:150897-Chlamydomonas_euryale.AAC.1
MLPRRHTGSPWRGSSVMLAILGEGRGALVSSCIYIPCPEHPHSHAALWYINTGQGERVRCGGGGEMCRCGGAGEMCRYGGGGEMCRCGGGGEMCRCGGGGEMCRYGGGGKMNQVARMFKERLQALYTGLVEGTRLPGADSRVIAGHDRTSPDASRCGRLVHDRWA